MAKKLTKREAETLLGLLGFQPPVPGYKVSWGLLYSTEKGIIADVSHKRVRLTCWKGPWLYGRGRCARTAKTLIAAVEAAKKAMHDSTIR